MAAIGLRPEDYVPECIELWPETEKSVSLFSSVSTQWRMGFSGPIGLDYNVVLNLMDRMKLSQRDFDDQFYDLRIAESEALSIINKRE